MSLGYNDSDINATITDLMPFRSPILYPGSNEEASVQMAMNLSVICRNCEHQIRAFKVFHQMTQKLLPHDEIIHNVRLHTALLMI